MKILSKWLRSYLPELPVDDRRLAEDLTLRGIAVEGVFDLGENGSLFEMDITTNRVDAMNHYGIAREAATIYGLKLNGLNPTLPQAKPSAKPFPVRIEATDLCGRFTARVLRNVKIAQSTGIVAEYFKLLEQKQISNAVDATNFTTLAIGHPTHAFDLDKLEGGIVVRRARKGERLKTLDGIERTLDSDDLVVADEKKALAIAGVMGGWDSMITPETKNILVEAAWFDPGTVRRSSKRHLLHTDASHRFERGADFNAAPTASALVSSLILEAGGEIEGELVDVIVPELQQRTASRAAIQFAVSEARRILGATEGAAGITAHDCEKILAGLGCGLNKQAGEQYEVTLPSWRLDLEREIDLIEEIARVYGYNRFKNTLPAFEGAVIELPWADKESAIRSTLLGLGWTEAVSSTFASATDSVTFVPQGIAGVPLGNPLSEEAGMLRPSLASGMLGMLALNLNRDVEDVMLFELGTVFQGSTAKVEEKPALALGATGRLPLAGPQQASRDLTFYDVKGSVETLLSRFAGTVGYDRDGLPSWLHPGRASRVTVDGQAVGYFGQLHPEEAQRRKLKQTVFVGEFYLDQLYKLSLRQPAIRELSRFQAVQRDFSFVLPEQTAWEKISSAIAGLSLAELQSFKPVEILGTKQAKLIPEGHVSLLLRTVFQAQDRTLQEDELQQYAQHVIATVESLGGKLRN